ncbi:Tastin [Tupaia chinensis]|uniref:Tastin n=1 Tax=Tupaia chinensis TaxID=246437 RepID=L8Y924_TUPCH|nr:Tastin [Tupaia chinensis]
MSEGGTQKSGLAVAWASGRMVLGGGGKVSGRSGPVPGDLADTSSLILPAFFPVSVLAVMTTLQARKDPPLRGVSPTPSKIPVRSQRRQPFPTVKSCAPDQENQDPRILVQKPPPSIQHPLVDSAGPRPKTTCQTEKSQRSVGVTQLRNPLEELRPSPGKQNVGSGPTPQTEAPGAIEFVADPAALATILSGEGVKGWPVGRPPSLAQRVLIRGGSQGGTIQRGQSARASAYLAPRTPIHRLDPARASCFSRLEGPGPRGQTLCPQRLEALDSRDSHLMPSPAPVAEPVPGCVAPSSITHPSPFGRAQRVPSPGLQPLARRLSGFSPQSCPEEPALPWEQVAVRLFDQEGCRRLQEGPGKPPVASASGPHPSRAPNFQDLKIQRISILQQLLRQEVEGLVGGKCTPHDGGPSLDMAELRPLLTDISQALSAPEQHPGTSPLPGLSQHPGLPQPCLPTTCGEPQPCPPVELGPPEACWRGEPETPEPTPQEEPVGPECCPPAEPGPLEASPQKQAGPPEPSPRVELGASETCSLEAGSPESSPRPCCSQWAPATSSMTISSQHPPSTSPPLCSLQSVRPLTGQAGPSSLAPRTLALRQRLKACLTAIHCFHEARLDDECAFYTSRAPASGPRRVCTNPVATLLEWQDALPLFIVGLPHGAKAYTLLSFNKVSGVPMSC